MIIHIVDKFLFYPMPGKSVYALKSRNAQHLGKIKQLDIVISPPAFVWNPYLTETSNSHAKYTFLGYEFNLVNFVIRYHHHTKFGPPKSNGSRDINFYLVMFGPMNYFLVTDRQTDRRKATHKSPPCMSTGGLKNEKCWG